jgi:hypothetical protein
VLKLMQCVKRIMNRQYAEARRRSRSGCCDGRRSAMCALCMGHARPVAAAAAVLCIAAALVLLPCAVAVLSHLCNAWRACAMWCR